MKKLKNKIASYINENLNHQDQFDSIKNKLNLQNNSERNYTYMKISKILNLAIPCILLVVALFIGIIYVNNTTTSSDTPIAVIQVDVNPSISLVINEEGKVISIHGENDEGKMIITDEDFIGMNVDEAIEKIIYLETSTGYLIAGAVTTKNNNITISIEAKTQNIAEETETKLIEVIDKVCQDLNVTKELEVYKSNIKEALVNRAYEIDPSLSQEKASKMSHEELIAHISGCQLEKMNIPTEELEALYDKVKNQEIQIMETELTKEVLANVDEVHKYLSENYDVLYNGLISAQEALNKAYVDYFVNEDSKYQQALEAYQNEKLEILKLETEINQMEESSEKNIKLMLLKQKQQTLESKESALELAKKLADTAIEILNKAIDLALQEMDAFCNTLPIDIKAQLNKSLENLEKQINESKDIFFENFEKNYKEELTKAIENSKQYKEELISQLKQN